MKVQVGNKQYFGSSEAQAQKLADTKILDTVNLEELELTKENRIGFGYYGKLDLKNIEIESSLPDSVQYTFTKEKILFTFQKQFRLICNTALTSVK